MCVWCFLSYLQETFLLRGGDPCGAEQEGLLHQEEGLGQVVLPAGPQEFLVIVNVGRVVVRAHLL